MLQELRAGAIADRRELWTLMNCCIALQSSFRARLRHPVGVGPPHCHMKSRFSDYELIAGCCWNCAENMWNACYTNRLPGIAGLDFQAKKAGIQP